MIIDTRELADRLNTLEQALITNIVSRKRDANYTRLLREQAEQLTGDTLRYIKAIENAGRKAAQALDKFEQSVLAE